LGAGFFTGVDYQLTEKLHLNGEIRYDQYQGSDKETTATMMNILFGLGYHF
jgi:opacity protein-like surface antigen